MRPRRAPTPSAERRARRTGPMCIGTLTQVASGLEWDDFSSNRHPTPASLFEHDLFRKPLHIPDQVRDRLFRDHALGSRHDLPRPGRRHRVHAQARRRACAHAGARRRPRRRRCRRRAGRGRPVRHRRARPLNAVGDRHGTPFKDGAITMPPGWKEAYRGWAAAGWNAVSLPARMGRPGAAACAQRRLHRDVEFGLDGVRHRPGADHGRGRGAGRLRHRRAQAHLSAQARVRRMDGHDAAHRAAGRLRRRRAAHQGRARGRRHLPHHRAEDLHHLRRARPHRQHHPFRAGAAARRAARQPGHLAVPGAEVPGQRGRLARRAQRRARAFDRAQARHPRLADLHHGLRRQGRRGRLPGRRGEPRARLHVHHDEPRAARGRPAGRRHRRARDPAGAAYARERKQGRAAGATARHRARSSSIPTSSACC